MVKYFLAALCWGLLPAGVFAAPAAPVSAPAPVLTPEQYLHLGNVSGRQENYTDAIANYTRAIEGEPDLKRAYYNRGFVYVKLKKYKLALADLNKAIELDPQFADAYHVRGIIYFWKKKYPQAAGDYNKAIGLDPGNLRFHTSLLSLYFKTGQSDHGWKEVIEIQKLGGTVNPSIIDLLKNKHYRNQD